MAPRASSPFRSPAVALRVKLFRGAQVVVDPVTAPFTEGAPLPAGDPCPNCGDRTPGRFCRHCGQARRVVHVSLREMVADFLDDQLTLNSRLPRSLAFLLVRPGHLTREYLRGRIASYIRPLRLYVGTSVLFFLVFALVARSAGWNLAPELALSSADSAEIRADSAREAALAARTANLPRAVPLPPPPPRPASAGGSMRVTGMGAFGDTLNAKAARFMALSRAERQRVLLSGLQDELPKMMFVMLPIFALLLKVLYVRRKRFYVEHFVFALHFHAFVFLLLTLLLGFEQIPRHSRPPIEGVEAAVVGWILLYLFLAMKSVYGQGFFRTGMKYGALLFSYAVVLVMGFMATALAFVYFL